MKIKYTYILLCLLLISSSMSINAKSRQNYVDEANELREKGRYDDAIIVLLEALEEYPKSTELQWLCANSYGKVNFLSESIRRYEKIAEQTGEALSYSNLGGVLGQQGYDKRAMDVLEKAIEIDEEYWGAYTNRAMVNAYHFRTDEALADFEHMLEADRDNLASTYYNLAVVYAGIDKDEKCEYYLLEYLKLKDAKPENLLFLEQTRKEINPNYKPSKKLVREALGAYTEKINHNWYDFHSFCRRGECYKMLGDKDMANSDYRRSLELLNEVIADVPDAWRQVRLRGILYSRLGEKDKAIKDFEYVLSQNPNEASVIKRLAKARAK